MKRYNIDYVNTWKFERRKIPRPDVLLWEKEGDTIGAWKDEDGEWVKYSDVEKLQKANVILMEAMEKIRNPDYEHSADVYDDSVRAVRAIDYIACMAIAKVKEIMG